MPAVLWAIVAAVRLLVIGLPLILVFLAKYFNFGLDTLIQFTLRMLDWLVSYAVQAGYVSSDFDRMFSTLMGRAGSLFESVQQLDGVLPVTGVLNAVIAGYGVILSIRLTRWLLSFIPTLNAG